VLYFLSQIFGKALKRRSKATGFKVVLRRRQNIETGEYMLSQAYEHEIQNQGAMLFFAFHSH